MLFQHGIYHADPHPGNLLVRSDGTIVFLDFGAICHLSKGIRTGIPRFLEAVLGRDPAKIHQALKDMGFVRLQGHEELGHKIIAYFQRRFLEQVPMDAWRLKDLRFDIQTKLEVIADFRELNISIRDLMATFQIPQEWILLQRTLMPLMGLVSQVDPEINPIPTIRPYIKNVVFTGDRDWKALVTAMIRDLLLAAMTLPQDIKRLVEKAHAGEVGVQIAGFQKRTRLFYALGHQLLFGLLALGSSHLAYDAWQNQDGTIAIIALKTSIFFWACLGGAMILARKWLN